MASRLRRRKRSPWLVTLLLLFILIGLCYAVVRVYFRAPDQKAGDSVMIQRVNTPAVSDGLSAEEAEALRSQLPAQLCGLRRRLPAARVVDGHRRPLPGQLQADGPADPPAAAGDQGHVSLHAHAVSPFSADTTLWKSAAVSM